MTGLLVVLTLAMGAGEVGIAAANWIPSVKAVFDPRISIADML